MSEQKRYVVTLDAYAYADSDEQARQIAQELAVKLRKNDDNHAGVVSIHEVPSGTIGQAREIKH